MNKLRQQNEWAEFREHLNKDMDNQVTSNKALLWTSVGILGVLLFICAVVIVNLLLHVNTLENKVSNIHTEMLKVQVDFNNIVRIVDKRLDMRD